MLLAASLANAGDATLYNNLSFNFLRNSTPIASIALDPLRAGGYSVIAGDDGSGVRRLCQGPPGKVKR